MTQQLFVYGTLRRDIPRGMFHLMAGDVRFVGDGRVRGRLYDLGAYPGVVLSPGEDRWVHGELYAFDDSNDVMTRLDEYEGCGPRDPQPHEFARTRCEFVPNEGRMTRAWIYEYKGGVEEKREVRSGDYRDVAIRRQNV